MRFLHDGASLLLVAMPHRSNYVLAVMKTRGKRAMLNTKDIIIVDILQIEADARRLRAQTFAAGFTSLKAKLVALFQSAANSKAEA